MVAVEYVFCRFSADVTTFAVTQERVPAERVRRDGVALFRGFDPAEMAIVVLCRRG